MGKDLVTSLRPALVLTLLFALLTGIAYPLALTGIGRLIFPAQANASIVRDVSGKAIGSALIGQGFAAPGYFHGRPSAAGKGYDATASSGSNYGPTSHALADRVKDDVAMLKAPAGTAIPADLVTASGSGLDPDISPASAQFQIARVSAARDADPARVQALVAANTVHPLLGFIGEPRVNVLALNRALDQSLPRL